MSEGGGDAHHLKIAYGVDDDVDFACKEFGALVRGEMTPIAALHATTMHGGECLGKAGNGGSIDDRGWEVSGYR